MSMRLGAGGFRRSPQVDSGWDMGLSMGGHIRQRIYEDERVDIWNWKSARTINVQIINTVAFRAVTNLYPPISPISFTRHRVKGVPGTPEPASVAVDCDSDRLELVKSMNQVDWDRGAALGVTLNGRKIILCVCCEDSICDSM